MATKKKAVPTPPLTIVAAYRRLDEIMGQYRNFSRNTEDTVTAIAALSTQCVKAGLPLNISITEEDLNETGITAGSSYSDSYEPDPSTEPSY
jgi:hypothetical protein